METFQTLSSLEPAVVAAADIVLASLKSGGKLLFCGNGGSGADSAHIATEFTCRFSWQPGSLALWDNRCTLHNPINDYHGYRREMHRITLEGDKPALA